MTSPTEDTTGRRDLLASVVAAAVALAGCSDRSETATTSERTAAADDVTTTGDTSTDATTTESATTTPDLDLREANVTGVSFEHVGGTEYRFEVTLHHDDDGEEGYANWWQVETLTGERLGRRELLHAHGTREFTRSATVDVGDATCVVVRGHDQTHGYGGRVVVVNLDSGEMEAIEQGAEAADVSDDEGVC